MIVSGDCPNQSIGRKRKLFVISQNVFVYCSYWF